MKVLIFCGGQGTRLRDVAENLPKPLVDVGGRPILWHIMRGYAQQGFTSFVLLLGYRGTAIKDFFLSFDLHLHDFTIRLGRDREVEVHRGADEVGWEVTLADTGQDAMTGARLARGLRYLEGETTFMATYGDGVADIDLRALLAFHRAHGKLATVTGVRPPGRFGEIATEGDRVVAFDEKPQVGHGLINGGFFVFERGFVERYLAGAPDAVALEREPLSRAARDGELMVHRHDGFWHPMDTYRDWQLLNELWRSGRAPWKTWP